MFTIPAFAFFVLFACPWYSRSASTLGERTLPELTPNALISLVATPDPLKNMDPGSPSSHLSKILIPRAPDTDNNTFVGNYIISTLKGLKWHIDIDEFTDKTPIGTKRFKNIVATKDPTAPRRVILSAHYDSKYASTYPDNQFLGATDSAAPCAMMLDLAEALNPLLDSRKKRLDEGLEDEEDVAGTTLQLVFFDGEEAFEAWSATDSIYGARHLAEKWATTYVQPLEKRRLMGMPTTELSGVEHLILLDLLGAPQPLIRSYYLDTAWLFDALISVERRLGESGAFSYGKAKGMAPGQWKSYFTERSEVQINMGYIGDDHLPFLERGVSVLHLIPEPFPRVWHSLKDDATALDLPTMRRWNLMLRVFFSEYLHLRPDEAHLPGMLHRSDSEL
ncbi:Glutaminyl-peptide cyclotransferase [Hypsizygus marmoreus]|uniref:Peptide hydrolase n=1 Tax=Hypsizygus marmoreus TaxID=39966 RepID=A0A369JGX3_HYPMA|nr:Glutaminyl-peptide cyclotransferase [Hypsizygus marmoreus]